MGNPALPYFHDPVYMIPSPGEKLNSVTGWADEVVTLGVKASAYWPNFPVQLPLPPVSSPTLTSSVAQWPQGRVCFSGQAKSTRTPQLRLDHSQSRGSRYQGTTTVSTTSCSPNQRTQRTGSMTSR